MRCQNPVGMEFQILGRLEVVAQRRQLAPRRAQQRVLLALLLLRANETVPADQLIDGLWGESPPETAAKALQGHVSALRKLFGAERIETQRGGYRLRLEPGELDLDRFETLLADARQVVEPGERAARLSEALELWRGEPLADFRYEAFAQDEIARLEELRLGALEERLEAELEAGRHLELVPELERLVSLHPLRERLRALRMLALYRSGRQADALHAYQDGRRLLAEELGIDPGPALKTLERQILDQDPALEPPQPPQPAAPRQERKRVTVLVAELSGPSDPEELGQLLEPALERVRAVISGFGASVQPLFANALIGIFGAPRTHEDDPDRAVRAAAALVEAMREDDGLTVRIGVEQGEALVTIEGERIEVTGHVVAAASRLQATAAAGGVALGDSVPQLTDGGRDRREVPFVGREDELALLERTYVRAVRESSVQLVTIAGEPGSGKTRLAEELRRAVEPTAWLEGRCLPYGNGVTFWALGEIVKAYAGILESDDAEASQQKLAAALAALLPESADRPWVEESLAPLVGVAPASGTRHERSFAAWRRFLEAIAERRPLVVLVEDLHWADPALIEFVDELVERAASVPLLVLCTARLDLLDRHPHWGGGKRNAATVTLPPLSLEETRELARALLGGEEPSDALVARAGGNPLFAHELARMEASEEDSLPESLQAVIAARLDTLAPEVKQAAMDAAVIGEVFWSGAVAAIGGLDQSEAEERLRRLAAADVARVARTSSVSGQSEYAFLHALVRDEGYNQIPKAQRARKHEAAAAWIEQLAGERVIDHAEQIAHHYAAALECAADGDAELTAKTRRYLVLAGDRALRLNVAAAKGFFERALALVPHRDPGRAHVLARIARAAQEEGQLADAERLYDEAVAGLRAQDDVRALGEALVSFYVALSRFGKTDEARKILAEAVDALEREPPGPELAAAYMNTAREQVMSARARKGLEWSERAIELAERLGLQHQVVRSLQFRGQARCLLNDLGGLEDLRESLRLGLETGSGIETAIGYVNLADWHYPTAGPAECIDMYAEAIEFSEQRGFDHNAYVLRKDKLRLLYDLGRWDELIRLADELVAWERSRGESWITIGAETDKLRVLVGQGRIGEASRLRTGSLEPARDVAHPQILAPALLFSALAEHANGDGRSALALLEEFEAATHENARIYRAFLFADVARVCVAADALPLAKRLATDLDVVAPGHVYGLLSGRAVIDEAEGRLGEALSGYTQAAALWREFGNVVEEAYALLGRGRCLLGRERTGAAAGPLAAARGVFERLGARPLVAEVDEHLARAKAVSSANAS